MKEPLFTDRATGMAFQVHTTPDPELFRVATATAAGAPGETFVVRRPQGQAAEVVSAY